MILYVFSNARDVEKRFADIVKKGNEVRFFPRNKMQSEMKKAPADALMYLDVAGMGDAEIHRSVKALGKAGTNRFGILDVKGAVRDVARVFFEGASDYIGREAIAGGIKAQRLEAVALYRGPVAPDIKDNPGNDRMPPGEYILSGNDWKAVKPGNEYTFWFVFIEIDNHREIKRHLGEAHLKQAMDSFRGFVDREIGAAGGKTWIWSDFGGVVLFPFDGRSHDAVVCAVRLMLSGKIFMLEESRFNRLVTYRVAIHIGNTVYKSAGDTGTIVSDSINSIFHLSQKFAEPDGLYLTSDVYPLVPQGLKKMLIPEGTYEGREIYRMRRLL